MTIDCPADRDTHIAQELEQYVQIRTFGRIRDLRIDVLGDGVVVRGWTNSYHVVQLAVLAIRERQPSTPVQLDIHVGTGSPLV